MVRISKVLITVMIVLFVAVAGLSAQTAPPVAGNADARIFSLDLGMVSGYGLAGNSPLVGKTFGINFVVADNFTVGFVSTTATNAYSLARLSYALSPTLGFNLYVGKDTDIAGGVGAYYNILRSRSDTAFSTALKLRLEYLFDTAGIGEGDIILAIVSSLGI